MEYQNQSQKSRSQTLSKISTGPAYLREWFKQENYFTNIFFVTYPTSKATRQGNRTRGIFVFWNPLLFCLSDRNMPTLWFKHLCYRWSIWTYEGYMPPPRKLSQQVSIMFGQKNSHVVIGRHYVLWR